MSSFKLSRRAVLKGLGVSLALPSLEIMRPRSAHAADPIAEKVIFLLKPNGHYRPLMTSTGTSGASLALAGPYRPLRAEPEVFKRTMVLSGLDNLQRQGGFDVHHPVMMLLTAGKTLGETLDARVERPSFDTFLGASLGLGKGSLKQFTYTSDPRYNETSVSGNRYLDKIEKSCHSWSEANKKDGFNKGVNRLHLAYEALFGVVSSDPAAVAAAKRLRERKIALIDAVKPQADALKTRLGAADRHELEAYMGGLRDLGVSLGTDFGTCAQASPEPYASQANRNLGVETKLVLDLIANAVACGRTRVATYLMDTETSERRYDFVTATADVSVGGTTVSKAQIQAVLQSTDYHRGISHHFNTRDKAAAASTIDEWHVAQFVYLANKLRAFKGAAAATLLDECNIVQTGSLSNGNTHDSRDLPVLVAGAAVSTGARHKRFAGGSASYSGEPGKSYESSRPFANLLVTLAARMGVALAGGKFGNSTGALDLG